MLQPRDLKALVLTAALLPFAGQEAQATHIAGGEIYWDCLGGNQYRFTLVIYRDCFGINLNTSYTLNINSPCGNQNLTVTTTGGVEISQLCQAQIGNSTCNGGTLPGIQQYIYTGVATLPPCDYWTISWQANYRNAAIQNLVNPGASPTYIQATLNNLAGGCEDSPQFTNIAIPYVCSGYPIAYSYGVFDPEGDSLVYSLVTAMGNGGVPVTYQAPHTPAQPIPGLILDPLTGQLTFNLSVTGNWVVVVQVDIYQNGVHIGTIMREMQFIAYPCTNDPPDPTTGIITNATGSAVVGGAYAAQVCESGSFCFDMVISDPNPGNVLSAVTNVAQNLPGATFSYTGTNPITCTVCWTASPGTSGFFPFIINVLDGACPIQAFQTYVYSIQVLPGLNFTVQTTDETCLGVGDGTATLSNIVGTAPFTFVWSNGATGTTMTGSAGNYSVQGSDANGCSNLTFPVTINAAQTPSTANAGADIVVCPGTDMVTLQGTATNATSSFWSGGSGTFIGTGPNIQYQASPGELLGGGVDLYFTTLSGTACPPDVDTVHVSLSMSFMSAALSAVPISCHGAQNGQVTFSPTDPSFTYTWNTSPPQSTASITNLGPGTYSILVTDPLGCDTTLSVTLTQPSPLAIPAPSITHVTCANGSDGAITVNVSGGTPPYSIDWGANAGTQFGNTATGLQGGIYLIQVTDANGCSTQRMAHVQAPMPITLVADVPDTVCVNTPTMLTAQATGGQGGYTYSWGALGAGNSLVVSFASSQVISVSVVDGAGCAGPSMQIPITVLDLGNATLSAWGDTLVCPGTTVNVGASVLGYPSSVSISWPTLGFTGSGPHPVLTNAPQSIPVTAVDGCGNSINTVVNIDVETPIYFVLPQLIAEGCAPLQVNFADPFPGSNFTYVWTLGNGGTATGASAQATYAAGTYTVSLSVTTPLGCTSTSANTGMVIALPGPNAAFDASPWTTDVNNGNIQFTDQSTGTITGHDWTFGNGSTSNQSDPSTTYTAVGTYTVQLVVTDDNGCTDIAQGTITITPDYNVVLPNAFTPDPNGGGSGGGGGLFDPFALNNDVFFPFVNDAEEVRLWIFNRWGELVFESDDMRVGWNGYYRGQLSPQDVYMYRIRVRFVDDKEIERTGDLTLIR